MSYNPSRPPQRVNHAKDDGAKHQVWTYATPDPLETVLGPGYFTDAVNIGMRRGDIVLYAEADNGYAAATLTVSSIAGGAATVQGAAASSFTDRSGMVAWIAGGGSAPDGTHVWIGHLGWYAQAGATAIADMPGWLPDVEYGVFDKHFCDAAYDQTTETGADETTALIAAMDYLASDRGGVIGGTLWLSGRSKTTALLNPPKGVWVKPAGPVASTGQGGTADSTYPITFGEGPGIVASHLSGPAILLSNSDSGVGAITIGATAARRAASISTGAQNRNCGVLLEPADSSGASLQRAYADGTFVRDQPADGFYACGNLFDFGFTRCNALNCGAHGLAIDCGELSGRTNKAVPGEFIIDQFRANNLGAHVLAIGPQVITVGVPYRGRIIGTEGFRAGNAPGLLFKSAGYYILGEQITVTGNATTGTSGFSGTTPTLDYGTWVAGRNIHFFNVRQIGWLTMPVSVGVVSGIGSRDIQFIGGYASTTAPDSTYFANVEGIIRGLWFRGVSGDFTSTPVDEDAVEALGGTGFGGYEHEGRSVTWGMALEAPTEHTFTVDDATIMRLQATFAFLGVNLRFGSADAMPSGIGTSPIGIQGTGSSDTNIATVRTSADSGGPVFRGGKQRSGFGQLTSGDVLTAFAASMPDGASAMVDAAVVRAEADSSANPYGRLLFLTRGATGALVEAGRIDSAQKVSLTKAAVKNLQSYRFSIADDAVATITISGTSVAAIMDVAGSASARGAARVHIRAGTSAFVTSMNTSGVTVGVGTTALAGTTGVDGQLNIAATTGGVIYIENRTGATGTYCVSFSAVDFASGELT